MDVGDPRAHRLIDTASGETNRYRRRALLYSALQYGHRGIQASKAYLYLGDMYEQMGNVKYAITYYTRSLNLGMPDPFVYFWRGQLYLQQKQYDLARADFETALELDLWSPEREEAEHYLKQLSRLE